LRVTYWKTTLAACLALLAYTPAPVLAKEQGNTRLTIEALRCQGNATTSCRFILGYVYLAAGDAVDEDEIQSATLRLSQLRNFKQVDIHLEKGSQRGKVILVVDVQEARPLLMQSVLGFVSLGGGDSEVLAGRLTDVNLFGKGKILDLLAQTQIPLAGPTQQAASVKLQYFDPQLLSATKYFLGTGVGFLDSHQSLDNGNRFDAHVFDANLTLGHRFGAFSYVTAGYDYRFISNAVCSRLGDGTPQSYRSRSSLQVGYGWRSDDPYFPTHGSQFQLTLGKNAMGCQNFELFFLQTWAVADRGYLSFSIQQLSAAVIYAHDFTMSLGSPSVRHARWYVEPGVWYLGYSTDGQRDWEAGMRVGVRLDTPGLGIVELFAFGVTDWHRGSTP
jgi:outer membrane protein assembly factor BamA